MALKAARCAGSIVVKDSRVKEALVGSAFAGRHFVGGGRSIAVHDQMLLNTLLHIPSF
jgi:hypothetical protein